MPARLLQRPSQNEHVGAHSVPGGEMQEKACAGGDTKNSGGRRLHTVQEDRNELEGCTEPGQLEAVSVSKLRGRVRYVSGAFSTNRE